MKLFKYKLNYFQYILIIILCLLVFLCSWNFRLIEISGRSMEPTYENGDFVIYSKIYTTLNPGDVVILDHDNELVIKRIKLIRNKEILVLGDNLAHSEDGRLWGYTPICEVIGKVL